MDNDSILTDDILHKMSTGQQYSLNAIAENFDDAEQIQKSGLVMIPSREERENVPGGSFVDIRLNSEVIPVQIVASTIPRGETEEKYVGVVTKHLKRQKDIGFRSCVIIEPRHIFAIREDGNSIL